MKAGFDFGTKNISAVLIDNDKVIKYFYQTHQGNIRQTFINIIKEIYDLYGKDAISMVGICGNYDIKMMKTIDCILAGVEANKFLNTGCRNILNIGCESYSLTILDDKYNYIEHSVNPLCASGTGSFIDHQAERMNLTPESLSELAYNFDGNPPSIATRCAVFAKSDIIHSQAKGYSIDAICAGLCEGMALSVLSNLLKGRTLYGNIILTGGVSKNKKIVSELSKLLNSKINVIEYSPIFNAIGAALMANNKNFNIEMIAESIAEKKAVREKLILKKENYPDFNEDVIFVDDGVEITNYKNPDESDCNIYIGLDIGSTSTKAVLLDRNGNVLAGFYTKTAGLPLDAVKKIFDKAIKYFSGKTFNILGVGTTGSGRKLIKSIINADMEINEITAHAKGALFINPDVDTIIEIGGQDSKYTRLKNGEVAYSTMNYVCAAGTGSFIEEQAMRLGISLDDISSLAEGKISPLTSDRCTVYMERDLNIYLSQGFTKEEIITAVLYSVRDNYLSKVSGRSDFGNLIFFQGATGRNKALVSIFEEELKKPVVVSKYCHLTGALGVAVLLKEKNYNNSSFTGMSFKYSIREEECNLCINKCGLIVYEVNGNTTAWGLKCGRDYNDKKVKASVKESNLTKIYRSVFNSNNNISSKKTIGIPKVLYLYEYYPLFKDFFEKLYFNVVIEEPKGDEIKNGRKLINSDFCAPVILTHGMLEALNKKELDYIFFPAIINEQNLINKNAEEEKYYDKSTDAYFCYYSEYAPVIISNLTTIDFKGRIISPLIKFNNRSFEIIADDLAESLEKYLNIEKAIIKEKFIDSLNTFNEKRTLFKEKCRQIIKNNVDKPLILFLGRPYTIFENRINLGIPEKFETFGFETIYQSMIDFDKDHANRFIDRMHWHYGQEIILASEYAVKHDNIYPVFLTCFRCSPDSYLISYIKDIFDKHEKPYLIIQLDEHTNDTGYETRIEAGIQTFINHFKNKPKKNKVISKKFYSSRITPELEVYIPYLSPVISELQKEAFNSYGYKAKVMPLDERMINAGYKYATGTECMPNVAIMGSFIETVKNKNLDPSKTILYMPTVCMGCNYNQFAVLIDLACEKAGLKDVKISNSNTLRSNDELPKELNVNLLEVNILGSLLYKLYYRFKPYEKRLGLTEKLFDDSFKLIKKNLNENISLMSAAREIRKIFEYNFDFKYERKPRVAILGDLYVKYNIILNQDIYSLIGELDCEILIPSFTETVLHFIDADVRENNLDTKYKRGLIFFEKRFESIFNGMLDDSFEPNIDECYEAIIDYGIKHYIAGETSINLGRALYYIKHKLVDAIIHINPVFCCPGVVTSSIFRKIQKDFNIPIIDLFYDGTNKPNKLIIPQLYYLNKNKR